MFEITKEFVEKLGINIKIEDSPPRHNLWMDCSKAKSQGIIFSDVSNALHNGCSELRIDTNERNIIARKMYSKLGYKELSILPTIYNGLPHVNLVLMEKYIGGHA